MGEAFLEQVEAFVPAAVVVEAVPEQLSVGFLVAAEGEGEDHVLVGLGAFEFGHSGLVVQQVKEGDVMGLGIGGLGEQCLIVDGVVGVGFGHVFPAMAEEVAGVGLVAVVADGHLWCVG